MKLSYIPYIIFLLFIAAFPTGAHAQLKESVEVEGQYQKEILHPDKLGRLPERMRIATPQSDLPYSLEGVAAEFVPAGNPIPATSFQAYRINAAPRGYVNLELGSWLNSNLKAGYSIINKSDKSLNIWLRHASTSLWKPFSDCDIDNRRFNYQEALGLEWSTRLANVARLDIGTVYHFGYFNYYGIPQSDLSAASMPEQPGFLTQTLNDFSLRAALGDVAPFYARNHWNMALSARHFAFRTATRETSLKLTGNYERILSADPADISRPLSAIGVDGDLQWLLYGSHAGTISPDSYGNLRLSPFYRWTNSIINVRAGLNIDLTFNADAATPSNPTAHYSLFHIAPDVRIDFIKPRFAAWIHATGGQQLQSLANMADRNLYCLPTLQSSTPLYVPVDAQIGFRLKPVGGVEIEGRFGYKISKNIIGGGWTIPLLYDWQGGVIDLIKESTPDNPTFGMGRARYNLKGIYAGARLAYKWSHLLEAEADLEYAPQSAAHGIFNGDDRPRWILTPGVEIHPIRPLTIGVNYEYRGVRSVWSPVVSKEISTPDSRAQQGGTSIGPGTTGPGNSSTGTPEDLRPVAMRLPDITRLNAHASYTFTNLGSLKSMTIGVDARNILNQRETLLPGLYSEGVAVSGSVQILF